MANICAGFLVKIACPSITGRRQPGSLAFFREDEGTPSEAGRRAERDSPAGHNRQIVWCTHLLVEHVLGSDGEIESGSDRDAEIRVQPIGPGIFAPIAAELVAVEWRPRLLGIGEVGNKREAI